MELGARYTYDMNDIISFMDTFSPTYINILHQNSVKGGSLNFGADANITLTRIMHNSFFNLCGCGLLVYFCDDAEVSG
jgi:hypothetical protein